MIMAKKDPKSIINEFIEQVLNRRKLEAMDRLVAEDFVERVPMPGQGPGRAGLKDAVGGMLEAFGEMNWEVLEQICEGEKVVTRFEWTGKHQGPFAGLAATGKKVRVWGVVIDVVKNGMMVDSRIIMDMPGLMQQLTGK